MTLRGATTGLLLVLALGACGQKGDLYLPGENPNPPTPLLDNNDGNAPLATPVESKTSEEDSDTPDTNDDDGF